MTLNYSRSLERGAFQKFTWVGTIYHKLQIITFGVYIFEASYTHYNYLL
jgi:hypothetical protein